MIRGAAWATKKPQVLLRLFCWTIPLNYMSHFGTCLGAVTVDFTNSF